ncbi:MAG: VWA domain-containing protein [Niabella sp.]|nr:VWA domain-containing protein [Niabella sp.]
MSFEFQYIYFIWLATAVLLFLFLFSVVKRWKRRTIKRIGEPALVKAMIRGYSPIRFNFKFLLLCLAFLMGVLSVMSLRKPGGDDGIKRSGIDVVFALDLSKSMLAQDVKPSRLLLAKQFISKLMDAMPNNRVGLVWFAGKAFIQMPISADHGSAQMYVDDASPDVVPVKGTVIGDALEQSLKAFGEREAKYKAVILISDGEDHDEKAMEISKQMASRGLMVNTVGIGSPEGTFIPDDSTGGNKLDPATGKPIISKLNEKELQQIAANSHGVYVHLTDINTAIKTINAQLAQIDKKVSGDVSLMSFSYYFWVFATIMALCLVAEQLLPDGRKIKKEE